MDHLCAQFDNFSFSRFGSCEQRESHTEADERYTHATTVCETARLMMSGKRATYVDHSGQLVLQ